MPDTLDDEIRALVASAVADAPTAPEIDFTRARAPRVSWAKRGALALAAVLAAGGGVVALQPAEEGDVETINSPTTVPAPAAAPSVIVTAGPRGVRATVGGESRVVTTEPMVMALALDDGTFVAQRRHYNEQRSSGVPEVPLLITESGTVSPLFDPKTVKGPVDLHDFSIVDGRRLLLYSVYEPDPAPEGAIPAWEEVLYTFDLESGAITEIDVIGGWEVNASRMHLAKTGLIIGTSHGLVGTGSFVVAFIPGSPAALRPLPQPADYGIRQGEGDECECPTNFFLDPEGTALYWVQPGPNGAGTAIYSVSLVESDAKPTLVVTVPKYDNVSMTATFGDVGDTGVVVSFYRSYETDGPPHSPIRLDGKADVDLDGYTATVGHNG